MLKQHQQQQRQLQRTTWHCGCRSNASRTALVLGLVTVHLCLSFSLSIGFSPSFSLSRSLFVAKNKQSTDDTQLWRFKCCNQNDFHSKLQLDISLLIELWASKPPPLGRSCTRVVTVSLCYVRAAAALVACNMFASARSSHQVCCLSLLFCLWQKCGVKKLTIYLYKEMQNILTPLCSLFKQMIINLFIDFWSFFLKSRFRFQFQFQFFWAHL